MINLLGALGIKFLLFDHIDFAKYRLEIKKYFNNNNNVNKLFNCPYCSGFWCGILVGLLNYNGFIYMILLGFSTAFISLTWSIKTYRCMDEYENFKEKEINKEL